MTNYKPRCQLCGAKPAKHVPQRDGTNMWMCGGCQEDPHRFDGKK